MEAHAAPQDFRHSASQRFQTFQGQGIAAAHQHQNVVHFPQPFFQERGECRTWSSMSAVETSADASPTPKEQIPFPVPATRSRSSSPTRSRLPEELRREGTMSTARAMRALTTEKASNTPPVGINQAFHGVIVKPQHHVGIQGQP